MGYKLCGCDVIGDLEIDPRMNKVYVENHKPKYNFVEDIRDFNKREDLPEELYNLDILDGSFPCFESGTLIKTDNGYKNIEDISIGDKVLTHKGHFQKVYNTMKKNAEQYYNVKIQGCIPFNVTENHPFYIRRMTRKNKFGIRTLLEPKWVNVKDLSIIRNNSNAILEQDYIGFPIIQEERIPEWNGVKYIHNIYGKIKLEKIKHNLDLTDKYLWYFIGRWFGDGWFMKKKKQVIICCGKQDRKDLIKVLKDANIKYCESEEKTTYKYIITNIELFEYMQQFNSGATKKHLTKDIFELPINLLRTFIDGYLSADGYYCKKTNSYKISSVSKELIFGLQQCIAKVYHQPTSITIRNKNKQTNIIEGRKVNVNTSYSIEFRKEKCKQQHFFFENNYLWIPFRSKELIKQKLEVYNFSVEIDESYTIYNLACHNCSSFSMAGERKKGWGVKKKFKEGQKEQTLDDLAFVFIETVAKLRPKVVISENVEGLLMGNAKKYVNEIYKKFNEIGYKVKHWLVKGEEMGVPQKRHRVFFIATRLPFNLDCINMYFNYEPITYGKIKNGVGVEINKKDGVIYQTLLKANEKDKTLCDTLKRTTGERKWFQEQVLNDNSICATVRGDSGIYRVNEKTIISFEDLLSISTFPQDYKNPISNSFWNLEYIVGMSVPPVMMKRVVTRLIESGLFDYKL